MTSINKTALLSALATAMLVAFVYGYSIMPGYCADAAEPPEENSTFPQEDLLKAFSVLEVNVIDPPEPMSDFTLETLQGEAIDTRDLRGKFVWLSFWKANCIYCRIETASKQAIWEQFAGENFVLLAVNFMESRADVERFVEEFDVTFPVLLDPAGTVNGLYRTIWTPTNIFIDPEGNVVGMAHGNRYWDNPIFFSFLRLLSAWSPMQQDSAAPAPNGQALANVNS